MKGIQRMKMLKIGVAGAGHLGKIHIKILKELSALYELVGFYDANQSLAKEVEASFGVTSFETVQSLIDQVDCLAVVTTTLSHFEVAKSAIQARKHVFIEKPLTETIEEAKEAEVFEMEDVKGEPDPFDLILDLGENKPKKKILIDKPEITQTNAIQEELICFHSCVLEHKQTPVPIDDGVTAMELAHRILGEMSKVYLK